MSMWNLDTAPPGRVLLRWPNHLYLRPHPRLAPFVAHYTITFAVAAATDPPGELVLMPDLGGCLVFSPGWGEGVVWGAYTKAVTVAKDFSKADMRFFVEFLPGGAFGLFGLPMAALAEQSVQMEGLLPLLYARMNEVLHSTRDVGQLARRVDALLLQQLETGLRWRPVGVQPAQLLPVLANLADAAPVRALADQTGYSERHLGRLFHQSFGVGVKAAARILRINRMLRLLETGAPLAMLAQQAGYYDQAHLNHDFKAVCGKSPSEYLAATSDFYKEEFKF